MEREYLLGRAGLPGTAGSAWLVESREPQRESLVGRVSADIAIVGAGLCGTLTAQALADRGASVVVLEARRAGSAVSGHTTAKATAQHGLLTTTVPHKHARAWLEANIAAIDRLEEWCARTRDGAAFERVDSHVYVSSPGSLDTLAEEARLFEGAGLPGGDVSEADLPIGAAGAVRLSRQAQFDPVNLIDGLLHAERARIRVFEDSLVREVHEESDHVRLVTGSGEVRAATAIFASHVPFFDTLLYMTRLFQERVYAMEIDVEKEPPPGMWYSPDEGAVAWRTHGNPRRLIVSGVQHKAGQGGDERKCYESLAAATRKHLGEFTTRQWWSTQDAHTPDGLPYVGKMIGRDHCYLATGFNGWGMTTSVVAADVLSALCSGEVHTLEEVLDAGRLSVKGTGTLAAENADFMARAVAGEIVGEHDPAQIEPGGGMKMRVAGKGHVAVARTPDGTLVMNSAHCTHMRCGVEYNEAEGTWDCPCHGSRFLADGTWLHGPTRRGLDPAES